MDAFQKGRPNPFSRISAVEVAEGWSAFARAFVGCANSVAAAAAPACNFAADRGLIPTLVYLHLRRCS
jgi:hypothetical protein